MSASTFWFRTWQQKGLFNLLLWPLSFLVKGIWTLRLKTITPVSLPVPVIVVGNLWPGGTGKTPLVIALVEAFQKEGIHVGVISRGHGRHSQQAQLLNAHALARHVGDEPLLIHRKTGVPVAVSHRRVEAAKLLLLHHPETQILISDDGLQHLELAHDVALVVMDERGLGNGWMLPAGPLREPWPRPSRARLREWVLSNGPNPVHGSLQLHRTLDTVAINGHGEHISLKDLAQAPVAAVCGIAKPDAFFQSLRQAGLDVVHTEALPDHAPFEGWQPTKLASHCWVCTEKDAVKIWPAHPEIWAIALICPLPEGLWPTLMQSIKSRIRSNHGQQTA